MIKRMIVTLSLLFIAEASFAQQQQREVKWVNPEIKEMEGLSHRVLKSNALASDVGYVVWTPAGYAQNPAKRYPVVYFLHGLGGTEASDAAGFSEIVSAAIKNELLPPVICVFPNGGVAWYQGNVEKMIIEELLPSIDSDYRTIAKAQSRALTGFSMGGYGSVYLSVMHPDLFCAAGSFGGRLRSNEQYMTTVEKAIPEWKKNNFGFFFVNGDNDRPDEFKDFATGLVGKGIESVVVVLPDTGHDLGKYYRESCDQLFKFIKVRLMTE
jgi:enterochelin esterase-like enzyme